MTSLRAKLLLGIVAANVTALSALAFVFVRDLARQARLEQAQREEFRRDVVEDAKLTFEAFFRQIDFNELDIDGSDSTHYFRWVLAQPYWTLLRDALIVKQPTLVADTAVPGNIELNPLGAPDAESEAMREDALLWMGEVFTTGITMQRENDIVVIPVYAGGYTTSLREIRRIANDLAITLPSLFDESNPNPGASEWARLRAALSALVGWMRALSEGRIEAPPTGSGPPRAPWLEAFYDVAPGSARWLVTAEMLARLRGPVDRLTEDLARRIALAAPANTEWSIVRYGLRQLRDEVGRIDETRVPWGAAYIRVRVPHPPTATSNVDFTIIALAMGGATAAAIASLWLLLRRLVLEPLASVSSAAVAVAGGALSTRLHPTGDSPELDALIANFNRMTAELAESRGALERRVEEALIRLRASEKQLARNERLAAMGTLAAGVAHEINNPLGGMMNAIATLKRRGEKDETTARYFGLIESGLARVRDVVDRVLRFSPSQRRHTRAPIVAVIDDAVRFVRHRARDRRVEIEVAVEPDLEIEGDGPALGQVFLNLLLNALDALDDHDPGAPKRVTITGDRDGENARIVVADNGCGMDDEQKAHAFDVFFTTKAHGTGIGLAIAHQIVTEHGGTIAIESSPGAGTRFEIRLPALQKGAGG